MVSLVMREKEIRTTQRYHYTTNLERLKFFNMTTPSVDEDAAAVGRLTHCWWDHHLGKPLENCLAHVLAKLRVPAV